MLKNCLDTDNEIKFNVRERNPEDQLKENDRL